MQRVALALTFPLLCAIACNSASESPRGAASQGAPAGHVLEVSGTVTVAGKSLAVGDTVTADTTVDTGADGNVVIELVHNLARWTLGPNKHIRVNESVAWREPKHTGPVAQVDQETTSAGQHAERMAAGTTASALEPPVAAPAIAPGSLGISGTGEGGGGTGNGIGIGSIGTLGHGAGTGKGMGYGTGNGSLGGSHSAKPPQFRLEKPTVVGTLSVELIQRIFKQHTAQMRLCYEHGLAKNPSLSGRLLVKLVISPDGEVPTVQDGGSTLGDVEVFSCVARVVRSLSFPKPDSGVVTVSYPISLAPN